MFLIKAGGGMGKSTFTKHLALDWAEANVAELNKFQFVFYIAMKHVKDNSSIENIIIAQHSGLEANKVQPAEIKSILEGDNKVLLLIDGHDEYKCGINSDIDRAIERRSLWKGWIILTSRKTEAKDMDAEIEILGFMDENVVKYIELFLGDTLKTAQLLEETASKGLCLSNGHGGYNFNSSLLTIPLLLHMMCVLFISNTMTLPKTTTGIMKAVVDRCIDREAIRAKGQKAVDSAKRALHNLGKLAWQGLMNTKFDFKKVTIFKFDSVFRHNILILGPILQTRWLSVHEMYIILLLNSNK